MISVIEEDLSRKNSFGTPVDISGYNSNSNKYTCPNDGYLYLYNQANQSGRIYVYGEGSSNAIAFGGAQCEFVVFVKKGFSAFCTAGASDYKFIPFN